MSGFDPNLPPSPPPGMPLAEQKPGNGLAIAALVLGVASLALFCVWYVALPGAILAIIFGTIGRSKARAGASGGGMATAGLICGVISIGLAIVMIGLLCAGISILGSEGLQEFQEVLEEAARQAEQGATTTSAPAP